jgi:MoaA/NifB/PqqE/SkfB family radical SAM enzyme
MDRHDIEKEKVNRLLRWVRGGRAPPVRIDLEPTSTCNLRCRFCWTRSAKRFGSRQYGNLLSDERIVEIVREGAELGVIEWQIAGGWEPLMKPRLLAKLVDIIKGGGMYGCITTSGVLFEDELIRRLVEIGWDEILFSLEGPDASTHDYLTCVPGSFDKATWAMSRFAHWKRVFRTEKPRYSFHAVLTNRNYDKLVSMIRLGFDLGCEGVNFESLSVWSAEGAQLRLSERQQREVRGHIRRAFRLACRLGVYTNVKNLLEPRLIEKDQMDAILQADAQRWGVGKLISSPCFEPWLSLEIRITGRVAPCRLCDDDAVCETVHTKSLGEVWFGRFFQRFRQQMMRREMPGYCYTCAAGNVVNMKRMRERLIASLGVT